MYLPLRQVADTPFHFQGDEEVKYCYIIEVLEQVQAKYHDAEAVSALVVPKL